VVIFVSPLVEGLEDFSDQEYLTRYFSYIAPPQGPLALNYVGPQPLALAYPSFYI